jgi:hypothetical protein
MSTDEIPKDCCKVECFHLDPTMTVTVLMKLDMKLHDFYHIVEELHFRDGLPTFELYI